MNAIDLVAMIALLQYLFFGGMVGRARGRYGVKAPAVTGHEMFERTYRVQMNTLELLVALIPALYAAGRYFSPTWVAAAGAVYVLGRFIYWRAYLTEPRGRALGFMLSMLPIMGLVLSTLMAAGLSWLG